MRFLNSDESETEPESDGDDDVFLEECQAPSRDGDLDTDLELDDVS